MKKARPIVFTMRMNETEEARHIKLAEHYGISRADLLRMILKREDQADTPTR
jgi:hypothetical protein